MLLKILCMDLVSLPFSALLLSVCLSVRPPSPPSGSGELFHDTVTNWEYVAWNCMIIGIGLEGRSCSLTKYCPGVAKGSHNNLNQNNQWLSHDLKQTSLKYKSWAQLLLLTHLILPYSRGWIIQTRITFLDWILHFHNICCCLQQYESDTHTWESR